MDSAVSRSTMDLQPDSSLVPSVVQGIKRRSSRPLLFNHLDQSPTADMDERSVMRYILHIGWRKRGCAPGQPNDDQPALELLWYQQRFDARELDNVPY